MVPVLGLLDYPGVQTSALLGLRDLLEVASRLNAARGGKAPALEVRILKAGTAAAGNPGLAALVPPPSLGELPEDPGGVLTAPVPPPSLGELPEDPGGVLTALVLPPSLGELPEDPGGELAAWLRGRHAEGTLLCSVCAGAFLLAGTGLLDGRPATTHWALKERFTERFPAVQLDVDRLLIDEGDLITAGGLMAWLDLGLRLVDRYLGPEAMLATARHFLVDPGGREQRFYSPFAPVLGHGDAAVLKLQHWLPAHAGEALDIARMAAAAGLGERTLLRRFQRATALRPTEYLQHLRVGKARDLLERSDRAIEDIAWQVGYADAGAFRRIFQRLMGLSPGEYRRRFSGTPPARQKPERRRG